MSEKGKMAKALDKASESHKEFAKNSAKGFNNAEKTGKEIGEKMRLSKACKKSSKSSSNQSKTHSTKSKGKSNKSKGRGWHGDPYGHKMAGMGIETRSKGLIKDAGKKLKEGAESAVSKLKESSESGVLAGIKEKAKSGYEKIKSHLTDKEDDKIAETVEPDLRNSMQEAVQTDEFGETDSQFDDYSKEELKEFIENGTPRELLDAVKEGEIIDADAVSISDQNQQELAQHLGDLKHDLELAEQYKEETEREYEEMERYLKEKHDIRRDEINEEWEDLSDDSQTDEKKNELEHELESYENDLKSQLSEYKAEYEKMKSVTNALEEVYDSRKEFVQNLIE